MRVKTDLIFYWRNPGHLWFESILEIKNIQIKNGHGEREQRRNSV